MGYRFQFITLAGWHALNLSMFELARDYAARGMSAYAEFQAREFAAERDGYTATRQQRVVGPVTSMRSRASSPAAPRRRRR
jgi:isocitrate lyase